MSIIIITLEGLRDWDSGSPAKFPHQRFVCPECGGHNNKRNLEVNHQKGVYKCFACGIGGHLGDQLKRWVKPTPRDVQQAMKPKLSFHANLARSGVRPIENTRGQDYLTQRGIPLEIAKACQLRFAGNFIRRAAVTFPIRELGGRLVAVHGRHIDRAEPRMHTIGDKRRGIFGTPGWQEFPFFAITEAPLDAISLWMLGVPATVAVCGSDLPPCVLYAAKGKTVHIATDSDMQGNADYWGFSYNKNAKVEHPTDAVTLNGKGWADALEDAGALVVRYLPRHAGQINPRTKKRAKDWNDELDFPR